jgi:hypothetical protein
MANDFGATKDILLSQVFVLGCTGFFAYVLKSIFLEIHFTVSIYLTAAVVFFYMSSICLLLSFSGRCLLMGKK